MTDRDAQESFIRIGPNWIPLHTCRQQKHDAWTAIGYSLFVTLAAFCLIVALYL